jgi:multidrug efflux pump subunit AcrB
VRLDRTDLDLGVDEAKAAALGVPAGAARRVARLALSGEETARFRDPDGDDYAVKVRLPMVQADELGPQSAVGPEERLCAHRRRPGRAAGRRSPPRP